MKSFIDASERDEARAVSGNKNYVKILNVVSVMVRVTDEGHRLLPGQEAHVLRASVALDKALNRGSVIVVEEEQIKDKEEKQSKKKTTPKVRPAAERIVAPAVSEERSSSDSASPKEAIRNEKND